MAEFRFDIGPLFPQPIVKVRSSLLPHTFRGDRRQCLDATSKMSEIIDRLGELSAVSQKLTHPVTNAQRLRMTDTQVIYLLADVNAGNNGAIVGLLKVGTKDLYLFDEIGKSRKVENVPCILDFYIHESRQRAGLGKDLFETMLSEEKWKPIGCSVDRPSDKLLSFLLKHYGLMRTIPQTNNFVIYEGFFDQEQQHESVGKQYNGSNMQITSSPNTQLFGAHYLGDDAKRRHRISNSDSTSIINQITQISPMGRYGARNARPSCSMAEIIHAGDPQKRPGHESGSEFNNNNNNNGDGDVELNDLTSELKNLQTAGPDEKDVIIEEETQIIPIQIEVTHLPVSVRTTTATSSSSPQQPTSATLDEITDEIDNSIQQRNGRSKTPSIAGTAESIPFIKKPPTSFQLSKQHTGLKNISFGVGAAVSPSNKMEFDQEAREDFGIVKINRPVGGLSPTQPQPGHDNSDAMSTVSSAGEGLTDQGYYDLKFYHNKLW